VIIDRLAHEVVRRYRAGVVQSSTRVEYSDAGNITSIAVKKLLKPSFGYLFMLRFRPSNAPNTVLFDGITLDDRRVQGRLVLHAAVRADTIVSWGEVLIDSVSGARDEADA
jgi:hypothetical protein